MPRRKVTEEKERPVYLSQDGTVDFSKVFTFQEKQTELLRLVTRSGVPYTMPVAPQCLSVGGIRGGKTLGWVMFGIMHYCLAYEGCNILVLRRTFKELEQGAITDALSFVPKELYKYDATRHVMSFMNESRVIFGHCANNKERDLAQYLGQAYSFIIVDECAQFSPDAWLRLYSRNTINAACKPDQHGNMPVPAMVGCTNPLGPFYEFYRTLFVEKEPWEKPEGSRKDSNGAWWIHESGEWRLIYDPSLYACQRSTVMDNPELLKRDPGIIARLNSLPKAKRDKMLLGLDGKTEGQMFDCFDPEYHVINLREDPEAIIWQNYQPVWGGQDWGLGHHNAAYLFTKALVRTPLGGDDYRLKTVCFREAVTSGGKLHREWASIFANMCKLPNGIAVKPKAIFFSREKFSKQVTTHSPADEYSKELKALGLPAVSMAAAAPGDRINTAAYMYNAFKSGDLVILDNCREIILAIPSLMRDPDQLDDVLKTESKGDDLYDAFRYGLYGMHKARNKPAEMAIEEHAKSLGPMEQWFYRLKMQNEKDRYNIRVPFVQKEQPVWQGKCGLTS